MKEESLEDGPELEEDAGWLESTAGILEAAGRMKRFQSLVPKSEFEGHEDEGADLLWPEGLGQLHP